MDANPSNSIDSKELEVFVMKAVGDIGSSLGALMVILGERLGLYKVQ